jgi:hypothetical protein
MHTKDILAAELRKAGLFKMADAAATGFYHDFLSPLPLPQIQLADDLRQAATPEALALLERVMDGEFDATKEESAAWAASAEGRKMFGMRGGNRAERRAAGERRNVPERLGDAPIEPEFHAKMNAIAAGIDEFFNGDAKGRAREVGFVMLVYNFGDADGGRCNFISNGADRKDVVSLMKEMIARFEGQAGGLSGRG